MIILCERNGHNWLEVLFRKSMISPEHEPVFSEQRLKIDSL